MRRHGSKGPTYGMLLLAVTAIAAYATPAGWSWG